MQSDLLNRAERLQGYAAQDPTNLALLRDLAATWHAAGEHQRALDALDRAEAAPGGPSALAPLRGPVLLALGRWQEAAAIFENALRTQPDSAALAFNLGYAVWASEQDPTRAVELFRQAARIEPGDARLRFYLALALESAADLDAARQSLDAALAIDPRHVDALAMLGRLALDAGDLDRATDLAARCIAARPEHPAGWQLKGQAALFRMDAVDAAKSLRQALDLAPDDADTRVSLAQAALMQGRPRHAKDLLQQAVAENASHDAALCMLGWACIADNEAAGAAAAFERANAAAPDNPDAMAGIALLRLADGRRDEALQWTERALALEPAHAMAGLLRARLAELDDRPAEARAVLASVLDGSSTGPLGSSTLGQKLAAAGASPTVGRMKRRFARALPAAPKNLSR
ncbi:MAG TPA: tetratricopeptide repeat protein [Burkholderiaceae bacterium]|nr:tetratricopeptide repeat protein [Burkholderiaceae bacterium]